jgi:multicomponent Na+:H+ antiporter subunit F
VIYVVVSIAILMTMVMAVTRALMGPSIYDRVLAANMFGTKTALLLSVVSFLFERSDFLDLALAYALINLVGVLAVLEFVESKQEPKPDSVDD